MTKPVELPVLRWVRLFLFVAALTALALLSPGADAQPSTAPSTAPTTAPAGATVLLHPNDLTGWRVYLEGDTTDPKSVWTMADGVLKLDTKTRGYLITEQAYSNYHLHVEWRWPADAVRNSNSGVLVHLTGADKIWPTCYECQLQNQNAGQVVGMDNDIPAAPMQQNRKRAPRLADPSEKPLGEWNTYDIIARGNTIEVFINGKRQNFVENLPSKEGKIALQMEGFPIHFRNIWLSPL